MTWVSHATSEVDAISQWRSITAVCVFLTIVSATVVGYRLWISFRGRGLAGDDYMALLSVVFAIVYSVLAIVQTRYGLGLPLRLRSQHLDDALAYKKINFAGRPIYQLGVSFFKLALLLSYRRLLQATSERAYRVVVALAIAAVFFGHLGSALALVLACRPVRYSWELVVSDAHPTCVNLAYTSTMYAAITIASDVLVAVLPVPVLLTLKISTGKKAGLVAVFLLGLFTTVCSILRLTQIHRVSFGDGNSTMLVLCGVIEFNIGNMVTSLPFLAPVFIKKARHLSYSRETAMQDLYQPDDRHTHSNTVVVTSSSQSCGSNNNALPKDGILKSVEYTVAVDRLKGSSP